MVSEPVAGSAYQVAAGVVDPELQVVTIEELGILRDVAVDGRRVVVTITPTYSGCPAMDLIRADVAQALRRAGWAEVEIVTRLDPPWSTDLIRDEGRRKLAAAGVAPPGRRDPVCPRCGGATTEQVSRFGATACTSVWRCRACAEPFTHLKAI